MSLANLLPGRVLLGRYEVGNMLGQGAMGVVYRGSDRRLKRPVALKVVATFAADPTARARDRKRFEREAIAAGGLRHPNVVGIYDFGTDPELDLDVLVMELLEGRDLKAWLEQDGAPPYEVAVDLIEQAARGLGAGHRAGLVHRDIKPSNLFASSAGGRPHLQVLDFGIVEITDAAGTVTQLTAVGVTPNTPRYASPEQLQAHVTLTAATDVYSLGLTAFQLLTGEFALDGASVEERVRAEVEIPARLHARGVASNITAVVARAVAFDPAKRFADADGFADAVAAALTTHRGAVTTQTSDEGAESVIPPAVPFAMSSGARRQRYWPWVVRPASILPACVGLVLVGAAAVLALYRETLSHSPDGELVRTAGPGGGERGLPIDTPAVIEQIRKDFQQIDHDAAGMQRTEAQLTHRSGPPSQVIIRSTNGAVRMAAVTQVAAARRVIDALYFRGDSLFFVFRRTQSPEASVPALEDRFYFHRGRLVRWLSDQHRPVQLGSLPAVQQETKLIGEGDEVLRVWRAYRAREARLDSLYRAGRSAFDRGQYAEALSALRVAADLGHLGAQLLAAVIVTEKLHAADEYGSALRWNEMAARQGSSWGKNDLGWMYDNGWGVPEDDRKAAALYREAANAGLARGQYNLGRMYQFGLGVPRDQAEARHWLELALANGEVKAKAALAQLGKKQP